MRSPDRGAWALLRSQGLGLVCGFGTAALLAAGSFVVAATRETGSRELAMDDLRPFFTSPSWTHAWFYALVPVFGLYVLNTLLATWHSLARKLEAGVRSPARYAAAVIHVAFVVALAAHLLNGFAGGDLGGAVLVQGEWTALPGGREARLESLDVARLPNGMPRYARAEVDVRAGGEVTRHVVDYNEPLSFGFGAELHLLAEQGELAVATLAIGAERRAFVPEVRGTLAGVDIDVRGVMEPGRMGPAAFAQVVARLPDGRATSPWLRSGRETPLPDGRPLVLEAVSTRPAIQLRSRGAPGNPWALLSAVLIVAGVALLWRRFLPRSLPPADDAA